MLTTSFESFYALNNLRRRAGLVESQIAEILEWDPSRYNKIKRKILYDTRGGLSPAIDLKIRRGLSMLILGFQDSLFPLKIAKTTPEKHAANKILMDFRETYGCKVDKMADRGSDPTHYTVGSAMQLDQNIDTELLIHHARMFSTLPLS